MVLIGGFLPIGGPNHEVALHIALKIVFVDLEPEYVDALIKEQEKRSWI